MSRIKVMGIVGALIVVILGAGLFYLAFCTDLLVSGTYYTKIDNAHVTENDSTGGVIHLRSSEPLIYTLPAVNESGDKIEAQFGASRELRQDAYLELRLEPLRGVVFWEEASPESLPSKVAEALS